MMQTSISSARDSKITSKKFQLKKKKSTVNKNLLEGGIIIEHSDLDYSNQRVIKNENNVSKKSININGAEKKNKVIPDKNKKKLGKISNFIFQKDTNLFNGVNQETTRYIEFLYSKIELNSYYQFFLSFISICSGVIQYELETGEKDSRSFLLAEWISFITTLGLLTTFYYDYRIDCEKSYYWEKLPIELWKKSWPKLSGLFFHCLIFVFHPNPIFHKVNISIRNIKFDVSTKIPLNAIMTSLMLFRLWFFFKILIVRSDYSSARTARVCSMNNFNVNFSFCIKGLMINGPFQVYGTLMILSIFFCSYTLRIFERGLDEASGINFGNYINSVWCIIITMTTVGFGDLYPSSGIGRTIGILSCFIGVFLISMLVVTITNTLTLAPHEENIYTIIEKVGIESEKFEISKDLIAKYFLLLKKCKNGLSKSYEIDWDDLKHKKNDFLSKYYDFQNINIELESTYPPIDNFDLANEHFNEVEDKIKKFENQQNSIRNNIDLICQKLNVTYN